MEATTGVGRATRRALAMSVFLESGTVGLVGVVMTCLLGTTASGRTSMVVLDVSALPRRCVATTMVVGAAVAATANTTFLGTDDTPEVDTGTVGL